MVTQKLHGFWGVFIRDFGSILSPLCPPFGSQGSPKGCQNRSKNRLWSTMAAFWDPGGHFPLILEPFGLNFECFCNFWVTTIFFLEATCFEEAYHRGGLGVSPLDTEYTDIHNTQNIQNITKSVQGPGSSVLLFGGAK